MGWLAEVVWRGDGGMPKGHSTLRVEVFLLLSGAASSPSLVHKKKNLLPLA
jgi:hypothetical protein